MTELKKTEELLTAMGIPADSDGYKYLLEPIELMQQEVTED